MADRSDELEALRAQLRALEQRVATLEGREPRLVEPVSAPAAAPAPTAAPETPLALGGVLATAATVSFCLVGALVLRLVAQRELVPPDVGTGLGLGYAAALLLVPHFLRRRPFWRAHGGWTQVCAALIAPLIVVEMTRSYGALSPGLAAVILAVFGLMGMWVAAQSGHRLLAFASWLGALAGNLAAGPATQGVVLRSASLLVTGLPAIILSRREGWAWLRPAVLLPTGLVLSIVALTWSLRTTVPQAELTSVVMVGISYWVTLLATDLRHRAELALVDAVWLPLVSAGVSFVAIHAEGMPAALVVVVAAVALAALAWRWSGQPAARMPPLYSVSLAAAGMGAACAMSADGSGLAFALVGAALAAIGARAGSVQLMLASFVVLPGIALQVLVGAQLHDSAEVTYLPALVGVVALLVVQWRLVKRAPEGPDVHDKQRALLLLATPMPLVLALLMLLGLLRVALWHVVADEPFFGISQSVVLAALSLGLSWFGRRGKDPAVFRLGVAGLCLLALKVVALDLPSGSATTALVSVGILGVASLALALIVRKPHAASPPDAPVPAAAAAPPTALPEATRSTTDGAHGDGAVKLPS